MITRLGRATVSAAGAVTLGILAIFLVIVAADSGAQQSTPGAHVDVSAKPEIALPEQPVTISGSTGSHEKKNQASVTVRHESGAPSATLTATVSPKGQFSVTFSDTKKAGKYKVSVTAPDGIGKGAAEFRVDSIDGLIDDVERVMTELDTRTDKLLAYVKSAMASLPPSKERDVVIEKVDDIESTDNTVDLPPVVIFGELRKVIQGPTVVFLPDQKILGELRDWVPEGEEAIATIDKSGFGQKPAPVCETIHTALEGAKFAAYAFSIAASPLKTLKHIAIDKGIPALAKGALGGGADSLAASSAAKLEVARRAAKKVEESAEKKVKFAEAGIAILNDITEYAIDHVFEHYCSEYKGSVKAKMTMVWKEGALPWLKYGVVLDGELRLRYPKEAPAGKPVYMTGEIEGNASNFTFWEDVTVVEPLPRSLLVVERRWLAPIPFLNSTQSPVDFGQVARVVTPAYFDVPVVAEMTGETIKMQFKAARHDFADAVKNRLLFVVVSGMIPDFKVFSFPIQKAHWILSKGLEDPTLLTVTEMSSGGHAIKTTKQTHKDSPDKSVYVDWTITIDASGTVEHKKQ